jgi:hypothetical protein
MKGGVDPRDEGHEGARIHRRMARLGNEAHGGIGGLGAAAHAARAIHDGKNQRVRRADRRDAILAAASRRNDDAGEARGVFRRGGHGGSLPGPAPPALPCGGACLELPPVVVHERGFKR